MSARQALVEGAKKATDASREQVYWYVGANDYWYEQLRRQPAALQELSNKVSKLSDLRLDSLRTTVSDTSKNVVSALRNSSKLRATNARNSRRAVRLLRRTGTARSPRRTPPLSHPRFVTPRTRSI